MEIEILNKSMMAILLLETCNFECPHCVRIDEPMAPGYQLSFRQLQLCLSDCRTLESIDWVHFSGGEPTLWAEGDRDLVDLLLEIAKAGYTPAFTTNGSSFVDYNKCHDFLKRYVSRSTTRLTVWLSIDTFHRNFDVEKGRAQSLDNVAKCKQNLPRKKVDLLDIRVIVCISKDFETLLPDEMIRHYESLGMAFHFVPLAANGKARQQLRHLCPDLNSDDPEDLGAYQRFHQKQGRKKPKADETRNRDKAEAICLIDNDYYLPIANEHDSELPYRWPKAGRLGQLPDAIVRAYARGGEA